MPRSLLVWFFTWLYMMAAGLVCVPHLLLTRRLDFTYAVARGGCRLLMWLAGVQVERCGPAPAGPACLYVANHQSNLDPPLLLAALPGEICFLAKKELFAVPILGWVLRFGGIVAVDRSNREAARASIAQAASMLRGGRPFLIFPEGTRTRDGRLQDFKKGPFFLAEQAGMPVVAVRLEGTGSLMPPGAWRIRPGRVQIHYHPAIPPAAWLSAPEPRVTLAALVRQQLLGGS